MTTPANRGKMETKPSFQPGHVVDVLLESVDGDLVILLREPQWQCFKERC